jgi:putative ABC transport system permease protein
MLGFFLLSPLFVWIVESVLTPIVALILGLRFALMRQQLSTGVWRAAGTATALMVGLAVLIVLQTEGTTALSGWKLPDKFPDIFIVNFSGIPLTDVPKLNDVPGIRRGELTPIAIASPGLPNNFFGLSALMIMPNATMFFGIDPGEAFKLMELDFRDGNAKDAERMLKMGRHVVVTNEFKQLKGLGVGDKITLQTIHGPQEYTIAGVVWSPGIDVIVSVFDMGRQMDERTAASMFGSLEDAKRDFGVERFYLFAANLNYSVEKEDVLKEVQHALRMQGMRAGDVREIKFRIEQTFYRLLLLVSTVAFAAMAVASLGVTNTILASIRTRRWQFGILRSIGLTRSQLLRLVLAEALLLGLVGCVMGVAAGLEMSMNAEAVSVIVTGYRPPIVIPWHYVWIGIEIVIAVSILASLGPAVLVSRAEPLELLQAGRSAT